MTEIPITADIQQPSFSLRSRTQQQLGDLPDGYHLALPDLQIGETHRYDLQIVNNGSVPFRSDSVTQILTSMPSCYSFLFGNDNATVVSFSNFCNN